MERVDVLGYSVVATTLGETVRSGLQGLGDSKLPYFMACLNPHSYVVARKDDLFQAALRRADCLLPDGTGIVLASKLLGNAVKERVAGFEYFEEFSRLADAEGGMSYFFLGASPETLAAITKQMSQQFPNIKVCGTLSPPFVSEFSPEEIESIVRQVNESGADVLWVGLTAPKQEKLIFEVLGELHVRFVGAIGAVFDFYAGTKARSPKWIRNIGISFLPRYLYSMF